MTTPCDNRSLMNFVGMLVRGVLPPVDLRGELFE